MTKLYPPWRGGIERVAESMVRGLRDRVDFRVLACREQGARVDDGVVTKASSLGIWRSMPVSVEFPALLEQMAREADVVHVHTPFPLGELSVLRSVGRTPVVVTYHSDIVRQRMLERLYRPFLRRLLERAAFVMPTSERLARCSPMLRQLPPTRVRPVVLGVPDTAARPHCAETTQQLTRFADGRAIILGVGRLVTYKGFDHLLTALRDVPDAVVVLVGDGPLRSDLQRRAELLGLSDRVLLTGDISDSRLVSAYRAARVAVLPSVSPNEAFGLVQAEAMAIGCPVVNTDLPSGVPFVSLHRQTGLTVPPGDPVALAAALRLIVGDSRLRDELGRAARRRYEEHFAVQPMLDGVFDCYRRATRLPSPAQVSM